MSIAVCRRGKTFSFYVPSSTGTPVLRSTGMRSKEVAKKVANLVASLKDRADYELLDAVADKSLSLKDLYKAHEDNTIQQLRARLRAIPIDNHVEAWLAVKRSHGMSPGSVSLYRQRIRKLRAPAGKAAVKYVHELNEGTIIDCLAALGVTPGTLRQYLTAIRSLCKYFVSKKFLSYNPAANRDQVERPGKNPSRRRWVRVEVDQAIVEVADLPYKAPIAFGHATGADRADLLRVCREHIDLDRATVRFIGTKTATRERLNVPIESWAMPYLREVCANLKPDDLLFPGLSGDAISRAHVRAAARAGVSDYLLRDGRHSYAIRAVLNGAKLRDVSEWLGHSNMHTTYKVYVHFDGEVKRLLDDQV